MSQDNFFYVLNPRNGETIKRDFCESHVVGNSAKGISLYDLTCRADKRRFQLELINRWNRTSATFKMGYIYFLSTDGVAP